MKDEKKLSSFGPKVERHRRIPCNLKKYQEEDLFCTDLDMSNSIRGPTAINFFQSKKKKSKPKFLESIKKPIVNRNEEIVKKKSTLLTYSERREKGESGRAETGAPESYNPFFKSVESQPRSDSKSRSRFYNNLLRGEYNCSGYSVEKIQGARFLNTNFKRKWTHSSSIPMDEIEIVEERSDRGILKTSSYLGVSGDLNNCYVRKRSASKNSNRKVNFHDELSIYDIESGKELKLSLSLQGQLEKAESDFDNDKYTDQKSYRKGKNYLNNL